MARKTGTPSDGLTDRTVHIGGASGFWGDSSLGPIQLAAAERIDYITFDYLAELTMSILAAARRRDPHAGYATDFVTVAMASILQDVVTKGIRIISNAGGMNPAGCAAALEKLAADMGIQAPKIAIVEGDDVTGLLAELGQTEIREMTSGALLPPQVTSANAYLGAIPIRDALAAGAQIVITGRCVDSAMTLGPLMHEFGWSADQYDELASGSLAGHVIECGCQATGGLHTDWELVPDWENIGYPIVEVSADGTFVVTKPAGTGGLVTVATVSEQILYEIGDPSSYLLPDVTCDFRTVSVEQASQHRVLVRGARGRPPGNTLKVSATYAQGMRSSAQLTIIGIDAAGKARRTGNALLARTSAMFKANGFDAYTATNVEILGTETPYGPHASKTATREVVLRITVDHPERAALELFGREIAAAGTSWAPGTTGFGGRPRPSPSIRQFAFLLPKQKVTSRARIGELDIPTILPEPTNAIATRVVKTNPSEPYFPMDGLTIPLIDVAYARSGDKGDISNIGVIARSPALVDLIARHVTADRVAAHLAHLLTGNVERYELPGLMAFNFVCQGALDGGGMASQRNDALGKGMAQILLDLRIPAPSEQNFAPLAIEAGMPRRPS